MSKGNKKEQLGIALTNGCFDFFHDGHAKFLAAAEVAATFHNLRLVIAINDDASVKRLKGDGRPVYDQWTRSFMLRRAQYKNVTIFDGDVGGLVARWEPVMIIRGYDQAIEPFLVPLLERRELFVLRLPKLEDMSTTKAITVEAVYAQ